MQQAEPPSQEIQDFQETPTSLLSQRKDFRTFNSDSDSESPPVIPEDVGGSESVGNSARERSVPRSSPKSSHRKVISTGGCLPSVQGSPGSQRSSQFVDKEDFVNMAKGTTRGHKLKVQKAVGKKDVRKYSFPNRAIEDWNKLPTEVIEASSIGNF